MISRRPVSSPGRVDKYPPPFLGLLRSKSNGGSISRSRSRSRSRGRSRASPLLVRRNKSAAAVTQEPSSPKVTCMGQIRANRSKPKIKPESRVNPTRRRCKWIRNVYKFAWKIKTISFCPKWRMFSFPCSRRKSTKDSLRHQLDRPSTESAGEIRKGNEEEEEEEGESFKIRKVFLSTASTPPINALLLTRSRSAPYRSSSSLAFRFWEENNQRVVESRNGRREQNVTTEKISWVYMSADIDRKRIESTEIGFVRRPPVLTRSKSEPARIGEKIG